MNKILMLVIITLSLGTHGIIVNAENHNINNLIVTMLYPYIKAEITNHYGYQKSFDLYNAVILNTEKKSNYHYQVKILIKTFEHAHNPPYGDETITFDISLAGIKTIDFNHKADKYEALIKEFYYETITDIKESFNLNLNNYQLYNYSQIIHLAHTNENYQSLYKIVEDIVKNKLKYNTVAGYKNVIEPVTYIKANNSYILYKLTDGTNVINIVQKSNDNWIVKQILFQQGKKMAYKLKWYM